MTPLQPCLRAAAAHTQARRRWRRTVGALALAWGCAARAAGVALDSSDIAGTPVPIPAGARTLGLGGAFAALADDATGAVANPGATPQIERPEFAVSGGWYWQRVNPEVGADETASDLAFDHASVVVPFFAWDAHHAIGVFWKRLFDFTRDVDVPFISEDTGDIADSRTEQRGEWSALGASYAIEPAPGFGIGFSVLVWNDEITGASSYVQRTTTNAAIGSFTVDAIEKREFAIEEGISAVLGLWWQPVPAWSFAVVVKPEYHLAIVVDTLDTVIVNGEIEEGPDAPSQQQSEFTYPTSVTIGVAHHWNDLNAIAVDLSWTNWSGFHQTEDGVATSLVNRLIDSDDVADGWSLHAGYERVFPLDRLVLVGRCGASWERLPGSTTVADAARPEDARATTDDYFTINAGFGIFRRSVVLDAAIELRYGKDVGTAKLTSTTETADVLGLTVRMGLTFQN